MMLKKAMSLILSFAIMFSVFSVTAVTANAETTGKIIEMGYCGSNVYYYIYSDGTLEISGSGYMYDYLWLDKVSPFTTKYNDIKTVIIKNGVKSIGDGAFSNCEKITNITISDSVKSIGILAFGGCTSLTSITIPDGVKNIGAGAFNGCEKLTSITLPNGITSIGDGAFSGCTNLTSVTIPASVTSIGEDTFYECKSLNSITIPDGVTSIDTTAFGYCENLTSVTIFDSVTSIGEGAFYSCYSLKDVYYTGAEGQWNQIDIGILNDQLMRANIHYNSLAETPEYPIGDVNNDNNISVIDATQIQKCLVGMITLTESQKSLADVNNDGIMSVLDATEIQKYLVGMSSYFSNL